MNGSARPDGPIIVRKYGGSSLATIARLQDVARDLKDVLARGYRLVVVVSAMGDQTDRLVRMALETNPQPPRRELDMLLTVGERISMSLLCMALANENVPAISLTGSQVGIITDSSHTDARITEVKAYRIGEALAGGHLVVVAGFQGFCAETREITTLGRGGSDTTAVALAHALGAERCEILKDVPGVMTADPKLVPGARLIPCLSFEQMQAIADAGCGVVHPRAVAYAARHGVCLHVGSSFACGPGTVIRPPVPPDRFPPEQDSCPAAAWQPFVLTLARNQAGLSLWSENREARASLVRIAERASSLCSLTAEWLDCSDVHWRWEGWGAENGLAPACRAAAELAARCGEPGSFHWEPERAVITLAGRRPESWCGALHHLRQLLLERGDPAIRLRTDGQAVRLLGPENALLGLLPELHDRVAVT